MASIVLPRKLGDKYLNEAKELLKEGDLVQASAKRGLKLEQHGGLWVFINTLAKESRDKDFNKFFGEANALHRNFYETEMEKESVEAILEDIDKLIAKLKLREASK
jgi:hypothetical protein